MKKIILIIIIVSCIWNLNAQNLAINVGGTNQYVEIPHHAIYSLTNNFTIEAWINPSDFSSLVHDGFIISKETQYNGIIVSCTWDGRIKVIIYENQNIQTITTDPILQLNVWQHIAVVNSGSELKVYLNGVQVGSLLGMIQNSSYNYAPFNFGKSSYSHEQYFKGLIDEIRIWDIALTQQLIVAYNNTTITSDHPLYQRLKGYYEFDIDSVDQNHDGNFDCIPTVGIAGTIYSPQLQYACNPFFNSNNQNQPIHFSYQNEELSTVSNESSNQNVLKIEFEVNSTQILTKIVCQTNGTTNIGDIKNARIWYTGSSPIFDTVTQYSTTIIQPSAPNIDMVFSDSLILDCGKHYFWLTYDIPYEATPLHVIDGTVVSATLGNQVVIPNNPPYIQNRTIVEKCNHIIQFNSKESGWYLTTISIYVNSTLLYPNITLTNQDGGGPVYFNVKAATGDTIKFIRGFDGNGMSDILITVYGGNGNKLIDSYTPTYTETRVFAYCDSTIITGDVNLIEHHSAQLNGGIYEMSPITYGFKYKSENELTWHYKLASNNPMSLIVDSLVESTVYSVQAFASYTYDTLYGKVKTFKTNCLPVTLPVIHSFIYSDQENCWSNSNQFPFSTFYNGFYPVISPYYGSGLGVFNSKYYPKFAKGFIASPRITNLHTGSVVKFRLYRSNYYTSSGTSATMKVYVNTTNTPENGTLLMELPRLMTLAPVETSAGWYEYSTTIPADTFSYVIFEGCSDNRGDIYVDEINIYDSSSCSSPPRNSLTFTQPTNNSVILRWNKGLFENQWAVAYKNESDTNWIISIVTDTTLTINELVSGEHYYAKVRSVCSNDSLSIWSSILDFKTTCNPILELPYVEEFEDVTIGFTPNCIDLIKTNTTSVTVENLNNNKVLRLYNDDMARDIFLILPVHMDTLNSFRVNFKTFISSSNYFRIGYISNPLDTNTFVPLIQTELSYYDDGLMLNYNLITNNNITGQERIALVFKAHFEPMFIDSLMVSIIPSCPPPAQLSVTATYSNKAVLNWEVNNSYIQLLYNIKYRKMGTQSWSFVDSILPPYVLNNLSNNTDYEFKVQRNCTNVPSEWSQTQTFSTLCDSITVIPWYDDFSNYSNPAISSCYNFLVSPGFNYSVNTLNGNSFLKLYAGSPNLYAYASLPILDSSIAIQNIKMQFRVKTADLLDTLWVGVMSNSAIPGTFQKIKAVVNNYANNWQYFVIYFDQYIGNAKNISLYVNNLNGNSKHEIDEILITPIETCKAPIEIKFQNMTSTSLQLIWGKIGTANQWKVGYSIYGNEPDDNQSFISNDTIATLSGLIPGVSYQFFVKSICSNNEESTWSIPIDTVFGVMKMKSGNDTLFLCNTILTDDGGPNSNYSNMFYGKTTIYPDSPNRLIQISGTFSGDSCCDYLYIYDGIDTTEHPKLVLNGVNQNILSITSSTGPLTIIFSSSYLENRDGFYMNIKCVPCPSCLAPTNLHVVTSSSNVILLDWEDHNNTNQWFLQFRDIGTSYYTEIPITTKPYLFQNLLPNQTFEFRVRSECNGNVLSNWTDKLISSTHCLNVELPLFEYFENYSTIPPCWSHFSSFYETPSLSSFSLATNAYSPSCPPFEGSKMLKYNSFLIHENQYAILYSPILNLYGAPVRISFRQYRDNSYPLSIGEGIEVFYNTRNSLEGATSLGFTSRYYPVSGWYESLDTIPAGTIGNYFVFLKFTSSYGNDQLIDYLSISNLDVPCSMPTLLYIDNVTDSTAEVHWQTTSETSSLLSLEYKNVNDQQWTTIIVNTTSPYTITNLSPSTLYHLRIKSICTYGSSPYLYALYFSTQFPPCETPIDPIIIQNSITDHSAIFTWTSVNNESVWDIQYKHSLSSHWISLPSVYSDTIEIQNLESGSTYEIKVRAICSNGNSNYTTPITFTTTGLLDYYTIVANSSPTGLIEPFGIVNVTAGSDQTFTFPNTSGIEYSVLVDGIAIPPSDSYTFYYVTAHHTITVYMTQINDENNENRLNIFPNPTTNGLFMLYDNQTFVVDELKVYNIIGQIVKSYEQFDSSEIIDLSDLKSGVYVLKILYKQEYYMDRIIKR